LLQITDLFYGIWVQRFLTGKELRSISLLLKQVLIESLLHSVDIRIRNTSCHKWTNRRI